MDIATRNLPNRVLNQFNLDQLNSAARSRRPDLRASPGDVLAWCHAWNQAWHFHNAHSVRDGEVLIARLIDKEDEHAP